MLITVLEAVLAALAILIPVGLIVWYRFGLLKIELEYERGMRGVAEDSYKDLEKLYEELKADHYRTLDLVVALNDKLQ